MCSLLILWLDYKPGRGLTGEGVWRGWQDRAWGTNPMFTPGEQTLDHVTMVTDLTQIMAAHLFWAGKSEPECRVPSKILNLWTRALSTHPRKVTFSISPPFLAVAKVHRVKLCVMEGSICMTFASRLGSEFLWMQETVSRFSFHEHIVQVYINGPWTAFWKVFLFGNLFIISFDEQ